MDTSSTGADGSFPGAGPRPVLWYVHHHGDGHAQRLRSVAAHLRSPLVAVSSRTDLADVLPATSGAGTPVVTHVLPQDDRAAAMGPGPFHHVPISPHLTARVATMLDVARRHGCGTAVVDVSVEAAVLARLAGLRVALVRQSGQRSDPAHRLGFESADVVIAPQHPDLEPTEAIDGLVFTGAFSRFDHRRPHRDEARRRVGLPDSTRLVVLVVGGGGAELAVDRWRGARVPSGHQVVILGGDRSWHAGAVRSLGRVDDPMPWLVAADAVITSAGWASCHEAVAAGARTALVPERRPFDEQRTRVDALASAGLVVPLDAWPDPDDLTQVLDRLEAIDPSRWDRYYDRRGASRFARVVDDLNSVDLSDPVAQESAAVLQGAA